VRWGSLNAKRSFGERVNRTQGPALSMVCSAARTQRHISRFDSGPWPVLCSTSRWVHRTERVPAWREAILNRSSLPPEP
jgi:hypothetical protein